MRRPTVTAPRVGRQHREPAGAAAARTGVLVAATVVAMAQRNLRPVAPQPASLTSIHRSAAGEITPDLSLDALRQAVRAGEGTVCVDLDVSDPTPAAILAVVLLVGMRWKKRI